MIRLEKRPDKGTHSECLGSGYGPQDRAECEASRSMGGDISAYYAHLETLDHHSMTRVMPSCGGTWGAHVTQMPKSSESTPSQSKTIVIKGARSEMRLH